ncbi:elongation factor P [bacterium]|nr:elongation factor P [bacterium]
MAKVCNLKKNNIVKIEGDIYQILQIRTRTPSARGAATLYDIRYTNMLTHQKLDRTYKGDEIVEDADLGRTKVQYLYRDDRTFHFMKNDDYSQHVLDMDQLGGQVDWLLEGQEGIDGMFLEGNLIAITLPHTVELEIIETAPSIKGASATARTKPATLATGAQVQVPEYISEHEMIKVNTETGEFISRV